MDDISLIQGEPIERRLYPRHRAKTRIQIRPQGKPTKFCHVINLSATGVAVATEDMSLRPGIVCDLSFAIDLGSIVKIHRRVAKVVYVKAGITGFAMEAYGTRVSKG